MSQRTKSRVEEFDPHRVRPLPGQPRKRFKGIPELAASIEEIGQSCPGIVTLVADDPTGTFDAQLVDGERRLRACQLAGKPFRAEVRPDAESEEIFVASFGANFGKQDHDLLEIAEGLDRMRRSGRTVEQLKRIAGKSDCWVIQHLNLLKLHPDVQAMLVSDGDADDGSDEKGPLLPFAIAQLLVPVEPPEKQLALARKITKGEMGLAAARRFVLRERAEAGDTKAYFGSQGPRRSLLTIDSILVDTSDRIGVFLDMPPADFNRLADGASNLEKRQLMASLQKTAQDLLDLAEGIGERLPKPGQRKIA